METDFTEEEVVENPTLKAAYNLAPLHQNQPLRWDYEVDLIGKKVFDKILHLCELCELPILVYGRLLPCKHIFCFYCARKCESICKRCPSKVQKVEELALGTVYVCTHGAPKHSTKGCHRTYLSQRDLQSHIAHRHMAKSCCEIKTAQVVQPQLPLTQQQAAAALHVSQTASVHNQSSLLSSSNQQSHQGLSTAPFIAGLRDQASSQESGQLLNPIIPGLGDMRAGSLSTSPAISQASPELKSNHMSHGMGFSPSHQNSDQSIYRPIDGPSLNHQLQQQQLQHHHRHQLQPPQQQQQQQSQMMRHSGSPGMPPMSKPMLRFNQPPQIPMSSSMLPRQGPQVSSFQRTAPDSPSEMQMSTQMHHQHQQQSVNLHPQQQQQNISLHQQQNHNLHQQQQNHNLHQQQQQKFSGMMPPRAQPQLHMQKNLDQMQADMDTDDYNGMQRMDNFGNMQKVDMLRGVPNMDNFNSMPQRNNFNALQERDNFNAMQKRESFNSPQNRDEFNAMQGGLMDASDSSPNPQGGPSRSKNVNLITVPIQDEGQYRPLPFVGQSQLPGGAANNNYAPFSSKMSAPNNPSSNFSPIMSSQGMGGCGNVSTSPRMQFNRPGGNSQQPRLQQPGNPQTRLSQPGNPMSNPGLMMNHPRGGGGGGGGIRLGANIPPNVQGALAGVVQALSRGSGGAGVGQGVMMPSPGSLTSSNNPRFNAQPAPSHWNNGNLRNIQPRMTQNLPPRPRGDAQFKQNYYK